MRENPEAKNESDVLVKLEKGGESDVFDVKYFLAEAEWGYLLEENIIQKFLLESYMKEPLYWFERAAELGYVDAMYTLGNIYNNRQEIKKAVMWYKKLVDLHHPGAKLKLGIIYCIKGDNAEHKPDLGKIMINEAIEKIDKEDLDPFTLNDLGFVHFSQKSSEDDRNLIIENIKKCIYFFEKALEGFNKSDAPDEYKAITERMIILSKEKLLLNQEIETVKKNRVKKTKQ